MKGYGKELTISKTLRIGSPIDIKIDGNKAYIIGDEQLFIADISSAGNPKIIGKISGLGNVRQIAVVDGLAYITSRHYGAYIVDVTNPRKPVIVCHYDTIELATGVCVSGNLLFIACRTFGVEIIDVSDPVSPVHLSTVRTGEAQSITVRDNYLYTGVWGTSELVITDISNPRRPKIVAKSLLDGFGDGVFIKGKYIYVSTGHHSNDLPRKKFGDPGFGRGHGLEIFDISIPAQPKFVSRIKFPQFYCIGQDMWSVKVSGGFAFCSDTHNGLYVVNVKNIKNPIPVAYKRLKFNKKTKIYSRVGALDVSDGYLYTVGGDCVGLCVMPMPGMAGRVKYDIGTTPGIPFFRKSRSNRYRLYKPDGQIHAVDIINDLAVVAAGCGGLRVISLWPEIEELFCYKTNGFAFYVDVFKKFVYVAEGTGGLTIWEHKGKGQLVKRGRYLCRNGLVKQVVVYRPGKYALLHTGFSNLEIIDISNPDKPKCVLKDNFGGIYIDQICHGLIEKKYACAFGHVAGLRWYDLHSKSGPVLVGGGPEGRISFHSGIVSTGNKIIITEKNGYKLVDRKDKKLESLKSCRFDKKNAVHGKARIFGKSLYITDNCFGKVEVVDITDLKNPKVSKTFSTKGNPGGALVYKEAMLIPDGYEGLRVYSL